MGLAPSQRAVMFTVPGPPAHHGVFTAPDHQGAAHHDDLLYKAVLKDRSRIVWKGMIA